MTARPTAVHFDECNGGQDAHADHNAWHDPEFVSEKRQQFVENLFEHMPPDTFFC
jgi:hypothetical protein